MWLDWQRRHQQQIILLEGCQEMFIAEPHDVLALALEPTAELSLKILARKHAGMSEGLNSSARPCLCAM